jgi:hypothetical protein
LPPIRKKTYQHITLKKPGVVALQPILRNFILKKLFSGTPNLHLYSEKVSNGMIFSPE